MQWPPVVSGVEECKRAIWAEEPQDPVEGQELTGVSCTSVHQEAEGCAWQSYVSVCTGRLNCLCWRLRSELEAKRGHPR